MVKDFEIGDEANVGYYVGLITSSFALAQLISGMPWGMLSDRIGRRPIILMGMMGTIISILLFGLSNSYTWAILSRSLCGLLNGNIGVLKSMISEITVDCSPSDRARAFSMLPLVFGFGSTLGPMLGGFLSNPVKNYPGVFGRGGFITDLLTEYPYFLPCLISASICLFGLVFGIFYLEESLELPSAMVEDIKKDQLLTRSSSNTTYSTFPSNQDNTTKPDPPKATTNFSVSLREALTPPVISMCIIYGLFSYQAIFYNELLPIWSASSRSVGGLGFSTNEIGLALAFSGVVTLFSQFFLLPYFVKRFGLVRLLRSVLFTFIFLYFTQGFVRYLYYIPDIHGQTDTKTWVWVGLLVSIAFMTVCVTISFTGCTILINDAANKNSLGTVNGFSQCCSSGMRALGPATCGAIWSSSLKADWIPFHIRAHNTFTFLAIVAVITYCTSRKLNGADYQSFNPKQTRLSEEPRNEDDLNTRA
ncbi:major facilitator superfamily domain-containing protein [Spinellus fusiger]|nr:major facilitator superfamily domain-containing protein [Spinellus fusiger]